MAIALTPPPTPAAPAPDDIDRVDQAIVNDWRRENSKKLHGHLLDFDRFEPTHPPDVRQNALIRSFLDIEHDIRPADTSSYNIARDAVARQMFDGRGEGDDATFFGELQAVAQTRKDRRDYRTSLASAATLNSISGAGQSFGAWANANIGHAGRDRSKGASTATEQTQWEAVQGRVREEFGDILPIVNGMYGWLEAGNVGGVEQFYYQLSDEERPRAIQLLRMAAQGLGEEKKRSLLQKLGERASRDIGGQISSIADGMKALTLTSSPGVFAGPEQLESIQQQHQMERGEASFRADFRSILEGDFDPVEFEGTLQKGIAAAPGVIFSSAVAVLPFVGQVATYAGMEERAYQDYRQRFMDAGMSESDAERNAGKLSMVAGIGQSVMERLGGKALLGRFPVLDKTLTKFSDQITNRALRLTARTGIGSLQETGIEGLQNLFIEGVQDIGHALNKEIPSVRWTGPNGVFAQQWAQAPETFIAILPLSIIGAAGGISQERRNEVFKKASRTEKLAAGITEEAIDRMDAAEGPASLAHAVTHAITTADTTSETAIDATHDLAEQIARARELAEDAQRAGVMPRVRVGEEIEVVDPETDVVIGTAQTPGEAVGIIQAHMSIKEGEQTDQVAYLASMIEGAVELRSEGDGVDTFDLHLGERQTVAQLAEESAAHAERAIEQQRIREQLGGGTGSMTDLVLGQSSSEFEGKQRQTLNRLNGGASILKEVHEVTHGNYAEAIRSGRLTKDMTVGVLRHIDQALEGKTKEDGTPLRFLPAEGEVTAEGEVIEITDTMVDEAVAELAEVEILRTRKGKRSRLAGAVSRNLTAIARHGGAGRTLKVMVDAMRKFFETALLRHLHMKRALADGTIDRDTLDEFRALLQGTTAQEEHDAAAVAEYEAMSRTGDPFSIGRAEDAAYLSAVESGDMAAAQEMVDEAAHQRGYDIAGFHGSPEGKTFNTFKTGLHDEAAIEGVGVTPFRSVAETYAKGEEFYRRPEVAHLRHPNSKVFEIYVRPSKSGELISIEALFGYFERATGVEVWDAADRQIEDWAISQGIYAIDSRSIGEDSEVWVLDPNQIKSSDPVTYDAEGNVVPLSKRFDSGRDEISFSISPATLGLQSGGGTRVKKSGSLPVMTLSKRKDSSAKVITPGSREKIFKKIDGAVSWLESQAPGAIGTQEGWTEFLRRAGVWGEVPMPPVGLAQIANDPSGYVAKLKGDYHKERTVEGTQEAAKKGMDSTAEMREIIGEGEAPSSFVVALHHAWGILSRMLAPVQQEGMWLRLVSHKPFLDALQSSIDGKFNLSLEQWKSVVQAARAETAAEAQQIGNSATANANSFFAMLERLNGRWGEVADIYAKPNAKEMGRAFWSLDAGKLGIKNKVQRFIGLTFGVPGVIMDRWKFVEFWLPAGVEGVGANSESDYFKYSEGTPEDPLGIYGDYGGIEGNNEVLSLALYEGFEAVLQKAIDGSPELTEHLGDHNNPGGVHWYGWNAIKNEKVGHSSLDLTKELQKQFGGAVTAEKVYSHVSKNSYFTEGKITNEEAARATLEKGKFTVERQRLAGGHGERPSGNVGSGDRGDAQGSARGAKKTTGRTLADHVPAFSLGSGEIADTIIGDVTGRAKRPETKVRIFSEIARRVEAERRDIDRIVNAFGEQHVQRAEPDPRKPKSLSKERAMREALRREELENEVWATYGEALSNEELTKLRSQPLHSELADPRNPLKGRLMSLAEFHRRNPDAVFDPAEYNGAGAASRTLFGGELMPDQAAQELLGGDAKADDLWDALEKEVYSVTQRKADLRAGQEALREARATAKAEAGEWLKGAKADQKKTYDKPASIRRSLAMLDAIIMALPAEERGKVGGYVQLAKLNSDEKRVEFLLKRIEKVDKVVERWLRGETIKQIDKTFDQVKVKKNHRGIPEGKIAADYTTEVEKIKKVAKLDKEEVEKRIEAAQNLAESTKDPEVESDAIDEMVFLLGFGNMKGMTSKQLFDFHANLSSVVETGAMLKAALDAEFQAETSRLTEIANREITGGKGRMTSSEAKRRDEARQRLRGLSKFHHQNVSFEWLINSLVREDKSKGTLESEMHKEFSTMVHRATHAEKRANIAMQERYQEFLASVYGLRGMALSKKIADAGAEKSETGVFRLDYGTAGKTTKKQARASNVRQIIKGGSYEALGMTEQEAIAAVSSLKEMETAAKKKKRKIADDRVVRYEKRNKGVREEMTLSQGQAINLLMLHRQEGLKDSMANEGYSVQTMSQMEEFLTPESKRIMDWLAAEYAENYNAINSVFKRQRGVNLPQIENYSPAVRIHHGEAKEMEIDSRGGTAMSANPSFVISRTTNFAQMDQTVDALSVYMQHMAQSNHYVAWADPIRRLRSAFGNAEVKENAKAYRGADLLGVINERINWMADGGNRQAKFIRELDTMRMTFTQSALAYNTGVAIKQLTSIPAYAFDMPLKDFARYSKEFMRNVGANVKEMLAEPYVRTRFKEGYERDVIEALKGDGGWIKKGLQTGMVFGKAGDIVPVIIGGWISKKRAFDRAKADGKTDAEAEEIAVTTFEMATDRAQQAGDMKDLSTFQAGGSLFKLFTMFKTSPRQYYANVYESLLDMKAGKKGSKKEFGRRYMIGGVILPLVFQFVGDLLRSPFNDEGEEDYDPWDYARAMLLGPLNGLFVLGDFAELAASGIMDTKIWASELPIFQGATKAAFGLQSLYDGSFLEGADEIASGIGKLAPSPLTFYDIIRREVRKVGLAD